MGTRDEFARQVQVELSIRAGLRCSLCKVLTKGPADRPVGVLNIGVASHIRAAAPGGPRFDAAQSVTDRRSSTNAIWLCANCARRIDRDVDNFPSAVLIDRKARHEEEVRLSVGQVPSSPIKISELPVNDRYLDERGIRASLERDGFRIVGVYRHEANTRVGLGEADYVVDADGPDGPARLTVGNRYGEDLVYIAVPIK